MNPVQLFAIEAFRESVNKYIKERNSLDGVKEALYDILFKDDGCGGALIFRYFPSADYLAATQELGGLDKIVDGIILLRKGAAYDILAEEKKSQEPSTPVQPILLEMIAARDAPYVAEIYDGWLKKRAARAAKASAPA